MQRGGDRSFPFVFGFSIRAHLDFKFLQIAAWNIQSAKDKLNDKNVRKMFVKYCFIILSEIKTSSKISCIGFTVYQNSAKAGHRGGVARLVKPCFTPFIKNLDKSYENIISYEIEFLPNVVFIGCYIAPDDSSYYDLRFLDTSRVSQDEMHQKHM